MALSPVWRHSLRLWLATSLSAGIMLWSRQDGTLFLALIMGATPLRDSLRHLRLPGGAQCHGGEHRQHPGARQEAAGGNGDRRDVLAFGYGAWGEQLPLVVARLIAGWLRLRVGYTVCCFVVVMGWLQHDQQRGLWIPHRLFWTAFGILIALLSLRRLRLALQNLRLQHPTARLWELLAQACESLLVELDSLRRQRDLPLQAWGLERQQAAMARFAAEVGERLPLWQQQLGGSLPLQ
jgi:hypothetical protein